MVRILKLTALISLVVLLNAITSLLFVQARVPATAQAPVCVDGDVNGDTLVDVADPVYLLQYLFDFGPAPVACAQTTPADVEAAVDAALARYFPRAGQRVFIREVVTPGATVDLISVPAGRVFMLEVYHSNTGSWEPNTKILAGGSFEGQPGERRPALAFFPGEVISLTNTNPSGNATAQVWGYWLDYAP